MAVSRRALFRGGFTVAAMGALGATAAPVAVGEVRRVARPRIYTCAEWGARQPNGTITVENHKPTYIVVHHTAGGNSTDYSLAHAFAISRGIQNFHMDGRGWIDSGQQLTNSRGGFVTEGRHRSVEILDQGTRHVQGANVANHNSELIGIENEGLYTSVNVPQKLWDSLVQLVAYIAQPHPRAPGLQLDRMPRDRPLWTTAGAQKCRGGGHRHLARRGRAVLAAAEAWREWREGPCAATPPAGTRGGRRGGRPVRARDHRGRPGPGQAERSRVRALLRQPDGRRERVRRRGDVAAARQHGACG